MSRHAEMVEALTASIVDLDAGAGADLTYAEPNYGGATINVHGNIDVHELARIAIHTAEVIHGREKQQRVLHSG